MELYEEILRKNLGEQREELIDVLMEHLRAYASGIDEKHRCAVLAAMELYAWEILHDRLDKVITDMLLCSEDIVHIKSYDALAQIKFILENETTCEDQIKGITHIFENMESSVRY